MTEKVAYVDAHHAEYGVEPICRALEGTPAEIAPSSYYAARSRPCSARELRDQELMTEITRILAIARAVMKSPRLLSIVTAVISDGPRMSATPLKRATLLM